jgi:DNA polymerase-3 subunit alpha
MVYQEQVMQAAQALAGFTLGGADLLRRAMGKKKVEEMQKQRDIFVKGCARVNKIPESKANKIFDLLERFAGYGFNKSHAAAYAIVAYQTAYLKANYPVEFLSALMTNDMGDTAKLAVLIAEARAMNVEVLPPDVNESQVAFAPARNGEVIRFGLAAIKGVGEAAVEAILAARREAGRFGSLTDLCARVDSRSVGRKALEALIKCGACDTFGETRASLFFEIDRALARAAESKQDKQSGQSSLFGMLEEASPRVQVSGPKLPEWPQSDLLAAEKELLGFYVTGHPLSPYATVIEQYALTTIDKAAKLPNRTLTRLGGMVGAIQNGFSKKSNKPYAMVTIEDMQGTMQMLCMNENYDKYKELLVPGQAVMIVGEINNGEDKPKIFPQEIMLLDDAPKKYTKQVHLRLHTAHLSPPQIETIHALTSAHGGACPLFLCFMRPGGEIIFIEAHEKYRVTPSRHLQQAVDEQFGEDTYYAKIDTALPEKQARRWERKPENGNGNGE